MFDCITFHYDPIGGSCEWEVHGGTYFIVWFDLECMNSAALVFKPWLQPADIVCYLC